MKGPGDAMGKSVGRKPRNRAAQDATLINVRALKARLTRLEARVAALEVTRKG